MKYRFLFFVFIFVMSGFLNIFANPVLKNYNFPKFTNVSAEAGLHLNLMGSCATWGDYNNDGLLDFYICNINSVPNALYENLGNGQFKDVTHTAGVGGNDYSLFAWWIDLDSDSLLDLYVVNYLGRNRIFRNNGNSTFRRVKAATNIVSGLPGWIDLNHDHFLDAFMTSGRKVFREKAAKSNRCFYNIGKFEFQDASRASFLNSEYYLFWSNWNDYNGDGYPDLLVTNTEKKSNTFYKNNADGTFTEILRTLGIKKLNGNSGFADFDNDGDQDLVMFEFKGNRSFVYENADKIRFNLRETSIQIDDPNYEYLDDIQIIDINNDGLLDLQMQLQHYKNQYDYKIHLYQNTGNFQFHRRPTPLGDYSTKPNINLAWGDYDNDGDLDFLAIFNNRIRLYRNEGTNNNFARLALNGTDSNLDGVGAKVEVITSRKTFTRWIGQGNSCHWHLRDQVVIGLGKSKSIQKIRITWPSGIVQDTLNPSINQTIRLIEPEKNRFSNQTVEAQLSDHIAKSMGGTCGDFDRDDELDLYVANHGNNSILYKNHGDGIFSNISKSTKITAVTGQSGALFFDFNNDGYDDLYILGRKHNVLLKNSGKTQFINFTSDAGFDEENDSCQSVIAADFNNDGFLDIYQGHIRRNQLFENSGDNKFINRTTRSGAGDPFFAHGMAAFDFDNDGDLDIYVANSRGGDGEYTIIPWPNVLYRNDGDLIFTNITDTAGVACQLNSKGVCTGDYDNDGDFDLYVSNDDTLNILFRNNCDGSFTDVTKQAGVSQPSGSHGCQFIDFNNDGFLDLYVSGGSYIPEKEDYSFNRTHPNVVYQNNGDGTFTDITRLSGVQNNIEQTPHIIVADFNNDGYIDVFAANTFKKEVKKTANTYFENRCSGNNWVTIKLASLASNQNAVGAKVHLVAGDLSMWREVNLGCGFGSSRSSRVYFGIGENEKIDKIEIFWPLGARQKITEQSRLPINQKLEFKEPYQIGPFTFTGQEILIIKIAVLIIIIASASFIFYKKVWLLVRKGKIFIKKEEQQERRLTLMLKNRHILEIRIDLLQYHGDYLLIHFIQPQSIEIFNSNIFPWGRQEITPFVLKKDKIIALSNRLDKILNSHLNYLQTPAEIPPTLLQDLKIVGDRIYNFLGLRVFFDTLFDEQTLKHIHLNFVVDDLLIPWHFAYDGKRDEFLCEKFPCSFSFGLEKSNALNAFPDHFISNNQEYGEKTALLLYGSWKDHPEYLAQVEPEVKDVYDLMTANKIQCAKIDSNSEKFISQIQENYENKKNVRIIHYSGHIKHNVLAISPNEFFDPSCLAKTYGIILESAPIIFLNGCQSAELWQTDSSLAMHFLKAGAAACIVTHAKLPERAARQFSSIFYSCFVEKKMTIAEALHQTRLAVMNDRKQDAYSFSEYDLTRFLYNLYGDPMARC